MVNPPQDIPEIKRIEELEKRIIKLEFAKRNPCSCYNIIILFVILGIGIASIVGFCRAKNSDISSFGIDMMLTFGVSIVIPYGLVCIFVIYKIIPIKCCKNKCKDCKDIRVYYLHLMEVKQEEVKQEEVKQEEVKQEEVKQEE